MASMPTSVLQSISRCPYCGSPLVIESVKERKWSKNKYDKIITMKCPKHEDYKVVISMFIVRGEKDEEG